MRIFLILILNILYFSDVVANDIGQIRSIYTDIKSKISNNKFEKIFCYSKSINYIASDWVCNTAESTSYLASYIKSILYFNTTGNIKSISLFATSESRDWEIKKEHYYYNDTNVAFVFTSQQTYLGYNFDKDVALENGPFIIEQREYYSQAGHIIKTLQKGFYKKNKKKVPVKYLKLTQIDNIVNINNAPFLLSAKRTWKKKIEE